MELQHAVFAEAMARPSFDVVLRLTVDDAGALWHAAMTAAVEIHGMDIDDVIETIGPMEDPAIGDCIALLAMPAPVAGCTMESFEINQMPAPASVTILDLPMRRAAAH